MTTLLLASGAAFFFAGTLGLLRLPDVYSRLHALTKADNLGLGMIVAGLALQAPTLAVAAKLVTVWLIALLSAATAAQLVGGFARRGERSSGEGS